MYFILRRPFSTPNERNAACDLIISSRFFSSELRSAAKSGLWRSGCGRILVTSPPRHSASRSRSSARRAMGFFSSSKTPGKGEAPPPGDADADANAGSATMTRAASSGDMTTIRVVATDAPAEAGGVPLAEVFDDPRWAEAVRKSPLAGCSLVTTCVDARTRPARARRRRDSPARISRSIRSPRDGPIFLSSRPSHAVARLHHRRRSIPPGRPPPRAPRAAAFRAFASPGPRTPQLRSLLSSHPSPPLPPPSTLDWIGKK